jgi:hypothetical protein
VIMQCSLAALMARGFRPSTNEPGHQQTTIQTLPKTIGLATERMMILDGFRRARNLSDYEGEPVEDAKVRECVEWASALLATSANGLRSITRNCFDFAEARGEVGSDSPGATSSAVVREFRCLGQKNHGT